jgi:L-alanine-DL-glutamate epimerase-like enolase superfamily enzyme
MIAIAIPLGILLGALRLYDTPTGIGLAVVHGAIALPTAALTAYAAFIAIPVAVEEAALADEIMSVLMGDEVELLHDVHERISPNQAVNLCKELEKYHLFFLEDPLPPEEKDHFRLIRQQSCVPIAMGELFNTQQEYVPLIAERLIDFIRIHISQIGGLSMARKVAALCEFFGVKTAWHGPGDSSPVAHAAGLALETAAGCAERFGKYGANHHAERGRCDSSHRNRDTVFPCSGEQRE